MWGLGFKVEGVKRVGSKGFTGLGIGGCPILCQGFRFQTVVALRGGLCLLLEAGGAL